MLIRRPHQVNIHTHLWGAVFSVGLTTLHALQHFSLIPSVFRRVSHHPFFYPSSLTFTTVSGKVLRLSSASYSSQPRQMGQAAASQRSTSSAPFSIRGLITSSVFSIFSRRASPFLSLEASTAPQTLSVRPPDAIDIAAFGTFFFASLVCLGFSATYHTIQCHSFRVSKQFNKLDYVGIVIMIVGSFLPALHYGFYCHPHFQLAYSVAISIMGTVAMYTVLAPRYATPKYRPYRTGVFLVLGLSAIIPVAHAISVYGYRTITETMGLRFLILSGALYVVGALLYAARIPERFAPGRFDLLGASHQIFHLLILAAAAAHYISLRRAYAFWHTVETLGSPSTQGVCAALETR